MKSLVIVESPAKAKTINKILGKDFTVKASVGHVRDLPEKELGVDIENNFRPVYQTIPGKEKIIRELRKAARTAGRVYLAPDPDREGEAIAWHIAEELKRPVKGSKKEDGKIEIYRITFNEITDRAVREAVKNPGEIDMKKVDAQQARRVLDRLVGYKLSPLLWRKVRRGLSAGRVQSVAVRLVVEREREIEAFTPVEYWSITGIFTGKEAQQLQAQLFKLNGEPIINREKNSFLIQDEKTAKKIVKELSKKDYLLKEIEKKSRKRNPSPPFITSTLQQEASRRLRFTPKKTMVIAQQLYEGVELGDEGSVGLITYMRTDSTRVADEAREAAHKLIEETFGKEYLPGTRPKKSRKKGKVQDAHEAIRPTYLDRSPKSVKKYLSRDQYALYKLIWNRFIASQMAPAEIERTVYRITDTDEKVEFRVSGDVIRFPGYMKIYTEATEDENGEQKGELPPLEEGTTLSVNELIPSQHFTQPPPRYSEATLVKALEEKGIGRPSTYAAILSTIQDRKYVRKEEGRLRPTELGVLVNDLLVEKFPELMDIGFTARMEDELDRIELGKMKWERVIKHFYEPFEKDLTEAMSTPGKIKPADEPTEMLCDKCGKPMVKRWGRHGRFLACTGFPECKNTKPLKEDGEKPAEVVETDEKCPECGSTMVIRTGRYGRFLACSRYPECKGTKPIGTGVKCPLDGGEIVEKRSRKGKLFFSCSNWPDCKYASWYRPVGKQCPECGSEHLLEKKDKTGKVIHFCPTKDCKYKEEIQLEQQDGVG